MLALICVHNQVCELNTASFTGMCQEEKKKKDFETLMVNTDYVIWTKTHHSISLTLSMVKQSNIQNQSFLYQPFKRVEKCL